MKKLSLILVLTAIFAISMIASSWASVVVCEPQPPNHPNKYWYKVNTVGGEGPLCNFHIKVYDCDTTHYSNWLQPPNWSHNLIADPSGKWAWVNWWANSPGDCIAEGVQFTFGFDNSSNAMWSHWVTTSDGNDNPLTGIIDKSENHPALPDGLGRRVHVPRFGPCVPTLSQWGMIILAILLMGSAVFMLRRRRKTVAT